MEINDLLWRVAQEGEYHPADGNALLKQNVLALAYPQPLFKFLSSVTQQELNLCMLELLSMIARGEDTEGLMNMQEDLEAGVWVDLMQYMRRSDVPSFEVNDETGSMASSEKIKEGVKMFLRLCYLSPWKVEVYASYITPRDMSATLSLLPSPPAGPTFENFGFQEQRGPRSVPSLADRPLVRSSGRRPVGTLSDRPVGEIGNRFSNKKMAFWRQFQQWRLFRRSIVHGCNIHPTIAAESMLIQHASGTINDTVVRRAW